MLTRPEGFLADFSHHDNGINYINTLKQPVALTSIGIVPENIPDARAGISYAGAVNAIVLSHANKKAARSERRLPSGRK